MTREHTDLDVLASQTASLADDVAALRADADARRADVEHFALLEVDVVRDLARISADLASVVTHLRATPYVADEQALRLPGGSGSEVMGYLDREPAADGSAYSDFEDLFRGSREEVQQRQQPYVAMLSGPGPVVDLGCGRGEFLELLARADVPGWGVDLDGGMVAQARATGLDARVGDIFEALGGLADASVSGVFSAQVIEHLAPPDMLRLMVEVRRVLTDDGVAVVETVNPHSVRALRFFWLDLTHTIPVYPESALMMARTAGFACAAVYFPGGSGDLSADLRDAGDFALICADQPQRLVDLGLVAPLP